MKNNKEAARMAGYISEFLHDYAPQFLTSSEHTLKSYRDALTLYIVFLEKKRHHAWQPWKALLRERLHRGMDYLAEGCKAQLPGNVQYTARFSPGISGIPGKQKGRAFVLISGGKTYQTPEMPEKESGRAYP